MRGRNVGGNQSSHQRPIVPSSGAPSTAAAAYVPPATRHPARWDIESQCAKFLQQNWVKIAFVTTVDAPWENPNASSLSGIEAYCNRIIQGLLSPLNREHQKFLLTVQRYMLSEEILDREFHPNGRLAFLSTHLKEDFNVPVHLRLGKFLSMRTAANVRLASSRSMGELRVAYVQYLKAIEGLRGRGVTTYVAARDTVVVDAVLDGFNLTLPKRLWRKRQAAMSSCADAEAEPGADGEEYDAADKNIDGEVGADVEHSALPGPVVHRWLKTATYSRHEGTPAFSDCNGVANDFTLSYLLRRTFLLPAPGNHQQQHPTSSDSDSIECSKFSPNPHLKMMFLHCVWLAAQPQAPRIDSPFTTIREQTKLEYITRVAEAKAIVESLQHKALESDAIVNSVLDIRRITTEYGLDQVEDAIYQCDVESGRARQVEGAKNEQNVWSAYEDVLVRQVVIPLHREILMGPNALAPLSIADVRNRQAASAVTYYRDHQRSAAAEALGQEYLVGNDPTLWVQKCLAMKLTDDELAIVMAHPLYDTELFDEERRILVAKGAAGEAAWESRRKYFQFRIFAEHCVQLPFYHFVDESALTLWSQTPATARQLMEDPNNALVWKSVGELDGVLLDLNGDHDVLACFEIKANAADIGKALKQGLKLSELLDMSYGGGAAAVAAAAPTPPDSAEKPPPLQMRVLPAAAPKFSTPYYQDIFPLYATNFKRYFGSTARRMERWYIVTNLPSESTSSSNTAAPVAPPPRVVHSGSRIGGNAPSWFVPCSGRTRHHLVDAMGQVLAQSLPRLSSSSSNGSSSSRSTADIIHPKSLDRSCCGAMARRLSAQMYGKKQSDPSPKEVLDLLGASGRISNVIWLERHETAECA